MEVNETEEVRVDQPLRDYGDRWVFPGDQLFVKRATGSRALVYCPASNTHAWLNTADLRAPQPARDMRDLFDRVELLERRVAELEDSRVDDQENEEVEDSPALPPVTEGGFVCLGCSNVKWAFDRTASPTYHATTEAVRECELIRATLAQRLVDLGTPEVTTCGCPNSDDDVHEFDCVNDPEHPKHDWRTNPYSLPPATREGTLCPACSGPTAQTFNGARVLREVRHENPATVDECVRRQKLMGWKG